MNKQTHVWIEGHGVEIRIRLAQTHIVDQTGSHNDVFTPFAVDDPGTGIIEAEDGTIAISLGDRMSPANQAVWANAHIKLLNILLDGHVRGSDGSSEIYVAAKSRTHNKGTVGVRIFDLFWKTASDTAVYDDFPTLLEARYGLRRKEAYRLAWALVLGAHISDWEAVDQLVSSANNLVIQTAEEKKTKAGKAHQQHFEDSFTELLELTITKLKSIRYP